VRIRIPRFSGRIAIEVESASPPKAVISRLNGLSALIYLCWKWLIEFNTDCILRSPNDQAPELKVMFARPPFECRFIFNPDAITLFPKLLCVVQVVGDFVKAAK
jgi:hypothetical protein